MIFRYRSGLPNAWYRQAGGVSRMARRRACRVAPRSCVEPNIRSKSQRAGEKDIGFSGEKAH